MQIIEIECKAMKINANQSPTSSNQFKSMQIDADLKSMQIKANANQEKPKQTDANQ